VAAALGGAAAAVVSTGGSGAQVLVTVEPTEGARISVNGSPASIGQPLALAPGHYDIEASAPGRQSERREVSLAAGENAPIAFELRPVDAMGGGKAPPDSPERSEAPATFTARFVSSVPNVEISLGDRAIGVTPRAQAPNLEVGKSYRFTAHKDGFKPYQGEFTATSAGELEVAVALLEEPRRARESSSDRDSTKRSASAQSRRKIVTGGLACSTRPAGAEVLVDGKPTGRITPVALGHPLMVPVGNRAIQFKMDGKKSTPRIVEIKEGEVARLVNVPVE
jgi:hypothetical protein